MKTPTTTAPTPDKSALRTYNLPIRLTDAETHLFTHTAAAFDWTLTEFFQKFLLDELPLQNPHRHMDGEVTEETLACTVVCPKLAARLERVANFNDVDVSEWLLDAIQTRLIAQEKQMIFNHQTGELVGDARLVYKAMHR